MTVGTRPRCSMCRAPLFLIETGDQPDVRCWWLCRDCDAPLERTVKDGQGQTIMVLPREVPCWLPRAVA
jgi:hypothetical protein